MGSNGRNTLAVAGVRFDGRFGGCVTVVLAAVCLCMACAHPAYADDAQLSELQSQIEATAQDYNSATERQEELAQQIAETEEAIETINQQMPAQQSRTSDSMRTLYLIQQESTAFLEALFSSESLTSFVQMLDYLDCIQSHNVGELQRLDNMKTDLEEKQAQLESDLDEADNEAARAERALVQAQAARQQAAEQAAAEAAAQLAQQQAASEEGNAAAQESSATDVGTDAANNEDVAANETVDENIEGAVSSEDVNWVDEKTAFVQEWTARIDAYLAGSPMAGQGATFAEAAWNYGVDPRWSPAIAYAESSLGAYCFLPYNAWGWGSSSWGSWEAAINDHVAGLARGYGSSLTYEAAQKYCPPNASHWYNVCLAQMNMI